jgi:hypothetical protein
MEKTVQSVVLSKEHFTLESAKKWILEHDYKFHKVDITPHYYRFRQFDPHALNVLGMKARSIPLGKEGYLIVYYLHPK